MKARIWRGSQGRGELGCAIKGNCKNLNDCPFYFLVLFICLFLVSFCVPFDDLGFDKGAVDQDAVEGAWTVLHHLHHSSNIAESGHGREYLPLGGGDRWLGSHEYGTEKDPYKCSNKMHGTGTW